MMTMPSVERLSPEETREVEKACSSFEAAWRDGASPVLNEYLGDAAEPLRAVLVAELLLVELAYRRQRGDAVQIEEYLTRFPDQESLLRQVLDRDSPAATTPPTRVQPEDPARPAPGPQAVPGYELLGELGRGAMSVVYLARQVSLNRLVALKMIGACGDEDERRRIRTEAEVIAKLQHPNIVQIHEVLELGGTAVLALEHCTEGSLQARLRGAPLTTEEAARLVETLARAVHFAHVNGVVHRDLKPGNVLLAAAPGQEDGRSRPEAGANWVPKVSDFGLARRLADAGHTRSGAVLGTPSYMAPEQARGLARSAGPAADTYALGAILYECLTGRPPFRGTTVWETLEQVVRDEPVAVRRLQPAVPHDLETICHKCLQKDPRHRYLTADELAKDLNRFLASEPITARPVGAVERARKWTRRHPTVAALLALVVVLTAAGAGGIAWAYGEALRERDNARGEAERAGIAEQEQRKLTEAATAATAEARREAEERRQALARSHVLLAESARREGLVGLAQARLDEVPTDLRCWEWFYLRRLSTGGLFGFHGHTGVLNAISFSPDGQRLVTASSDTTARLWDARTGRELLALRGHGDVVNSAAWSPDGRTLATASKDGTARLWDAVTGGELLVIKGHANSINAVAFGPDGRTLATASWDGTVGTWDARTGQRLLTIPCHEHGAFRVAFSPDGGRLATSGSGQPVKLWDAKTGQELLTFADDSKGVWHLEFSPDGRRLATATWSKKIAHIWDTKTGQSLLSVAGDDAGMVSVAFSPDGGRLATGGVSGVVKLWDLKAGQELRAFKGHAGWVTAVSFSDDSQRLASASFDGTGRLWDVRSPSDPDVVRGHAGIVSGVCFSPDGQRFATAGADQVVKVRGVGTGRDELTLKGHMAGVLKVRFSPDNRRVATTSQDRTARLWDAATGKELVTLRPHDIAVTAIAFSPDGQRLATGGADQVAKVWDVRTGQELLALLGHPNMVSDVAFSNDGKWIVTSGGDVRLWSAQSGREIRSFKPPVAFDVLAFSPHPETPHLLAVAGFKGSGGVCDVRSGEMLTRLRGHTSDVNQITFSPDGRRVVTSSADGTAKVWDARSGQEVFTLAGHASVVSGVAFSPDGRRIATSSVDGTARLWDAGAIGDNLTPDEMIVRRSATSLDAAWQAEEAARREKEEQWSAATFHLEQALAARPADDELKKRLVQALTKLVEQQPESSSARARLALAQLSTKQVEACRQTCKQMQERFRTATTTDQVATVRAAVLRPDTLPEPEAWLPLLPGGDNLVRGAVLYRAGNFAEAVKELESSPEPLALLFRALAEHGRREPAAAWTALEKALKAAPPDAVDPAVQVVTPWPRRVEFEVLRREAEGLIQQPR